MTEGVAAIHGIGGDGLSSWGVSETSFSGQGFQFGVFELDSKTGELRREGRLVRLRNQPFLVLSVLLTRAGDLVTRDEIKAALWADNVDVDVEQGLNYCIKEIRSALGDNADAPRFIQTLPKRGYRFLADVRRVGSSPPASAPDPITAPPNSPATEDSSPSAIEPVSEPPASGSRASSPTPRRILLAASAVLLVAIAFGLASYRSMSPAPLRPVTEPVRLVVLPFADLSVIPEPYLSDGLTDELIATLSARTEGRLRVIARSSSLAYRERPKNAAAFAREVGASHFVEGTIRREAAELRVTVSLARAEDGTQVWAKSFESSLGDLRKLEREVAQAIGAEVRVAVRSDVARDVASDSAAYLEYLRGRFEWNKRGRESLFASLLIFETVTKQSPEFALGWAGLADAYSVLMDHGHVSPKDAWMRARAAAEKAVSLDPELAEAWTTLGMIRGLYEWDARASSEAFERAAAINPNYSTLLNWRSILLRSERRYIEAHENLRRARELDPFSLGIRVNLSGVLIELDRGPEAVAEAERIVSVAPQWGPGLAALAEALVKTKRYEEAEDALQGADRAGAPAAKASLASLYAARGKKDLAIALLRTLEEQARASYVSPYLMAIASAALDRERAFRALEAAFEERSPALRLLRDDSRLEALRSDPRFERMVRVLWPDNPAPRRATP